jgi:hypothetical protein
MQNQERSDRVAVEYTYPLLVMHFFDSSPLVLVSCALSAKFDREGYVNSKH